MAGEGAVLTPEEAAKLLGAPADDAGGRLDLALIYACYAGGLQAREVVAANRSEVDFVQALWQLPGRTIPLDPAFWQVLDVYVREVRPACPGQEALFLSARKDRLSVRTLQTRLARYDTSPQILRNSYIAHLLAAGVDLQVVGALLAHRSLATTRAHLQDSPTRLRRIFDLAHPRS